MESAPKTNSKKKRPPRLFSPLVLIPFFLAASLGLLVPFAGDGVNELRAQEFLKDILTRSPGPLSNPHKDLDSIKDCIQCHQNRLGGEVANEKCANCHTDIKDRLEKEKGYHWNKKQCQTCHVEHKGREYNNFAPENWLKTFDHSEAGYELLGKHAKVECRECHTDYRTNSKTKEKTKTLSYLNASTACYDCHKKDYEHQFTRRDLLTCTECHSSNIEGWKKMAKKFKFNHNTQTRYPLEGKHVRVECTDCHKPDAKRNRLTTFAPLASEKCTDCHSDPHKGSFGNICTTCHSVYRDWKNVVMNKDSNTTATPNKKTTSAPTVAAKGFDHSKTRFPLKGFHQGVACDQCHTEKGVFKFPDGKFDECSDCHGFPHERQFQGQRCESCHSEDRHYTNSTFTIERHNKLNFGLSGKHQVLDCNKCHFSGTFEGLASKECSDCHRNPHDQRQIDKTCSFCHITTSFSWIQFDHNKNTDFKLTGKHRDVACLSCHVDQVFKNMPATNQNPNCQACHDDPHGGAMKAPCQDCHRTEGFSHVEEFDHRKVGGWSLTGRHAELSCQKCHSDHLLKNYKVPQFRKDIQPKDCGNCHTDIHHGKFGPNCESCHTTASFSTELGSKVHDLGYFKLEGYHDKLACNECHRPDTNLQGRGEFCAWCHEKNDIHIGRLGPMCGDCHGQLSWLPTKFKHNTTAFRLTGAHRYVECQACHKNQIYQGLPNDCYFCHSDSYLTSIPSHIQTNVVECSDCHSTINWLIQRGSGLQKRIGAGP